MSWVCTAAEIRPDIKLTAGKPAAPVASGGPGQRGRRGGGLGNLSCIFPLLFLSHSFSPAHSSSSSSSSVFLLVLSVFSLCSDYIFLSRSALLLLSSRFSLSLSTFEVISPGLTPAPLFFSPPSELCLLAISYFPSASSPSSSSSATRMARFHVCWASPGRAPGPRTPRCS